MRNYTGFQIFGFVLSHFIPPGAVYFTEGCVIDFWTDCLLCCFGIIPGSIYATYIWIVRVERKWQTKRDQDVTRYTPLIFSNEFEERSPWNGNGQDGIFGYFDGNIRGGGGQPNKVGGSVDPEQGRTI